MSAVKNIDMQLPLQPYEPNSKFPKHAALQTTPQCQAPYKLPHMKNKDGLC